MPAPVYYIAVGVLAVATALYIWLNSNEMQPVPQRANRRNSNTYKGSEPGSSVNRRKRNIPEPDSECMICCEKQVTTKFIPCEHACMCEQCVKKYFQSLEEARIERKCPYCRNNVFNYETY